MYKVIIELKKDITEETLKKLTEIINAAFDNRLGKVSDSYTASIYHFEFVGEENKFNCMQLGLLELKNHKLFWDNVLVWEWVDEEEPEESCNVIEEFSEFVS